MIGTKSSGSTFKVEGTQVAAATFHRTGEVMWLEAALEAFALEYVLNCLCRILRVLGIALGIL